MSNIQAARPVPDLTAARKEASGQQVAAKCFATVFDSVRQKPEASSLARQRKAERQADSAKEAQREASKERTSQSDTENSTSRADVFRQQREEARAERSQAGERTARETNASEDGSHAAAHTGDELSAATAQAPAQQNATSEIPTHATQAQIGSDSQGMPFPQDNQVFASTRAIQPDSLGTSDAGGGGAELLPDHAFSLPAAPANPSGTLNAGGSSQALLDSATPLGAAVPAMESVSKSGTESATASAENAPAGTKDHAAPSGFANIVAQVARTRGGVQAKNLTPAQADVSTSTKVGINSAEGPEDLARVLKSHVSAKHSNMVLRLDPPELGRVLVDVRMHDQNMTVRFQAETEAGHDAIQGRLHELTGALEQSGVKLERMDVEFRPPQQQQDSQPQGQQHAYQQNGGELPFTGNQQQPSWSGRESSGFNPLADAQAIWTEEPRAVEEGVDYVV